MLLGFLSAVPGFAWLENPSAIITLGAVGIIFAVGMFGIASTVARALGRLNPQQVHTVDRSVRILRATGSAYAILVGPWLAISALGLFAHARAPKSGALSASLLAASVAAIWIVWLRGFRVRISGVSFEYRNGLYRRHSCHPDEVRSMTHRWVGFSRLGRRVSVPRLVVELKDGTQILINSKVFSRVSLRLMRDLLTESVSKSKESISLTFK